VEQTKEQLKQFLEAYSQRVGLTPEPTAEPVSNQGLAGGDEAALPSASQQDVEGTTTAAHTPPSEEITPPSSPATPSSVPQQSEQAQPEEVAEEAEEWLQPLSVDKVVGDIDDLQFLTNPRQTLQQIVERIDQHYRQQIERIASPLLQSTFALQARLAEVEFYVRHPDLIPHSNLVNQVAQELLQNPAQIANLTPQQIEAIIVQRVQERLRSNEAPPSGVVRGAPPSREPVDPTKARVAETLAALGYGRKLS